MSFYGFLWVSMVFVVAIIGAHPPPKKLFEFY